MDIEEHTVLMADFDGSEGQYYLIPLHRCESEEEAEQRGLRELRALGRQSALRSTKPRVKIKYPNGKMRELEQREIDKINPDYQFPVKSQG